MYLHPSVVDNGAAAGTGGCTPSKRSEDETTGAVCFVCFSLLAFLTLTSWQLMAFSLLSSFSAISALEWPSPRKRFRSWRSWSDQRRQVRLCLLIFRGLHLLLVVSSPLCLSTCTAYYI